MKKRSEVDIKETWKLEDMYANDEAFYKEIEGLKQKASDFSNDFKNIESLEDLYKSLKAYSEIDAIIDCLGTFAGISMEVDTSDQGPIKRYANFTNNLSKISSKLSFYEPSLAKLDKNILEEAIKTYPEFAYFLEKIEKKKAHMLTDEAEALLASLEPSLDAPYKNYNDMRYGDMAFENFQYQGEEIILDHNTFEEYLEADPRTDLRREAFKRYHDVLRKYENADASVYNNQVTTEKRLADIRGYESVFHYLLARQDVDFEIYEKQLDTIMEKLAPHMRKYAQIIKRHYGLEEMTYADLKLGIDPSYELEVDIDKAREYILDGLSPLGDEYVSYLDKAFADRWIDYAQNTGKRTGAFCASPYKSHPYIMTCYNNAMSQVMTLAHELGHACQGIYSNSNQEALVSNMSMYFVEAPSTANEITMERYLLKKAKDKREKLWVLSTMIGKTYYHNFVTHFLEASFQRDVYRAVERGESLGAADFNRIFKENLEKFWKDSVKLDEGSELTWMRQPHYYMGLYPYTYSAGLTIGTIISDKIVNGDDEDRKRWIEVLKLGGSKGPIELAKEAGVDMTNTHALEEAIAFIGSIIDQIDELLEELDMYK
ncbi:oligoendopeptidase F [Anaerococcus tetradius]|uniref:oligoendopeptidase F n=1 Tax=Anaerococcus tetradius TaxID=33036 RepID=UPI0023F14EF5|nr:oligoendopeptidase F [Anaerococcus tetradius]